MVVFYEPAHRPGFAIKGSVADEVQRVLAAASDDQMRQVNLLPRRPIEVRDANGAVGEAGVCGR